jgi:hypothetical protein
MIIGATEVQRGESATVRFLYQLSLIRAGNSSSNGHRSIRLGSDSHRQDFAGIILQRPDYDDNQEEFSSSLRLFGNCPAGKLVPERPISDNEFFLSFE